MTANDNLPILDAALTHAFHKSKPLEFKTKAEALEIMAVFGETWAGHGINFAMLFRDGGKYVIHPRTGQPCIGELRAYNKHDYRPSDLFWPFPKTGRPIAVTFICRANKGTEWLSTSPLSPYRNLFTKKKPRLHGDGRALTVMDTAVDANYLAHFAMMYASSHGQVYSLGAKDSDEAKLLKWMKQHFFSMGISHYTWPIPVSIGRVVNAEPIPSLEFFATIPEAKLTESQKLNREEWAETGKDTYFFYDRAPYWRNKAGNLANIWSVIGDDDTGWDGDQKTEKQIAKIIDEYMVP